MWSYLKLIPPNMFLSARLTDSNFRQVVKVNSLSHESAPASNVSLINISINIIIIIIIIINENYTELNMVL